MSFADFLSWPPQRSHYSVPQSWAFPEHVYTQPPVRRQPQRPRSTVRPVDSLFGYPGGFAVEDYDPEDRLQPMYYPASLRQQPPRRQPQRQQQQPPPSTAIRNKPSVFKSELLRERQRLAKAQAMQLNACARCIQRWYRAQLKIRAAAALAEHCNAAALTIQRFLRDVAAIQHAKQIKAQLLALADVQHTVQDVCDQYMSSALHGGPLYDDRGRVRRDILCYEEGLTKSLIALDNVPTLGSDVVRSRRKDMVAHIQGLLNELDAYKESCTRHHGASNTEDSQRMQTD